MVSLQRWTQWKLLHWSEETIPHFSMTPGKTWVCCFLVEKKKSFYGHFNVFSSISYTKAEPCKPMSSPSSLCQALQTAAPSLPQHWVANSVDCGCRQQEHGFTSAELFPCFQEFAFLGHLFYLFPGPVLPSPNRVWSPHIQTRNTDSASLKAFPEAGSWNQISWNRKQAMYTTYIQNK